MTIFNCTILLKALRRSELWNNNAATNLARLSSALGDIRTNTHGLIRTASQTNMDLSAAHLNLTYA